MSSQSRQEKTIVNGNPIQGPQEKAGVDSVPASMSFHNAGIQIARQFAKPDEAIAGVRAALRTQILTVLEAPQDSWESFTDGMKQVLDERKKDGKPTATLAKTRSEVTRVLNAAKLHYEKVCNTLRESADWRKIVSSMPKKTSGQGAGGGRESPATETENETNVGTLYQVVSAALKRMVKLGKEKHAYFAYYVGKNTLDMLEISAKEFQRIFAENAPGGTVINDQQMLKALGLIEAATQPEEPAKQQEAA